MLFKYLITVEYRKQFNTASTMLDYSLCGSGGRLMLDWPFSSEAHGEPHAERAAEFSQLHRK